MDRNNTFFTGDLPTFLTDAQAEVHVAIVAEHCKRGTVRQCHLVNGMVVDASAGLLRQTLFELIASGKTQQGVVDESCSIGVLLYLSVLRYNLHGDVVKLMFEFEIFHVNSSRAVAQSILCEFLLPFEDIYKNIVCNNIILLIYIKVKVRCFCIL